MSHCGVETDTKKSVLFTELCKTLYRGTAEEPEWTDVEPGAHLWALSNLRKFADEIRDVFNTLHCESRHVANGQGIAASAW
jgi:hypothetical protein